MSTQAASGSANGSDSQSIDFYINGTKHHVSGELPAKTSLNEYIRDVAGLKGTKWMCREGGCGSCAVTVTHAGDGDKAETMSINSCLCPLYSVDGWQISTVEGIGNDKAGFHPIQERLAKYNGTQCGYCSPGFVMSMYGVLHQKPNPTRQDIEDSFDGHICRCTGYRSILDGMTSFGSDSTTGEKTIDIEDLNKHLCPKTGELCHAHGTGNTDHGTLPRTLDLDLPATKWYRPLDLKALAVVMEQEKSKSIRLCFGNTSTGIFKNEGPYDVYIDLRAVTELFAYEENPTSIKFGAGTTLTKFLDHMQSLKKKVGFHYCKGIARHIKVVANVLVRNAGSIAGNLMIKHTHPDFPSDIFTMMECVGATLEIFDSSNSSISKVTLLEFLRRVDMTGMVILSVTIPSWNASDVYRSFKITPRWQNAHAYVNAAFKIPVDKTGKIMDTPRIVLGGINAQTVHATKTEAYLNGQQLNDQTISEALKTLFAEIRPSSEEILASPKYRKELAANLLYKTLLEICTQIYSQTPANLHSGGKSMDRPLSSGIETYQEKKSLFPITEALPKKTAILQTSGEAEYINDMPQYKQELAAAMVVSTQGLASIKSVDTTEALKVPGVVKYISAADIPKGGINNAYTTAIFAGATDELFATKEVDYAGKLIGLILAETLAAAEEGQRKVKVTYENIKTPVVYIQDAIAQNTVFADKTENKSHGDADAALKKAAYTVDGDVLELTQAHFYLENQIALAVPSEDGIDIYSSAQSSNMVQNTVSQVLGKTENYINVVVPRIGGGFGGKTNNAPSISSAAAVASEATGRPVRLIVDLNTNMSNSSKRFPIYAKYTAGCDSNGKITAVDLTIYVDNGNVPTPYSGGFLDFMGCGYQIPNIKCKILHMKTNKTMAGPCRGPCSVPAALIFESIVEHLAKEFGQHPILFKEPNLLDGTETIFGEKLENCTIKTCWTKLKALADIPNRMAEVSQFNLDNVWRKRGITMTTVKYPMKYQARGFPSHVSVFGGDGTVSVTTSGTEMGQGLYMKVAQAVAKVLGVHIDDIKVRPNQNNVNPNPWISGGSTTSERCVASCMKACEAINARLAPVRQKLPSDADWKTVVKTAYESGILLAETAVAKTGDIPVYNTYMVGAVESEIDVLTGEFQVKRVDIMGDVGQSMNPTIDMGQIQGAFVMGLGAYLTEDIVFDVQDGQVLNPGTWEYKPPTTKDIPIDWRVHFLPDSLNVPGVLSSKATGEPSIGLSTGALLSIKLAVEKVREEFRQDKSFVKPVAPFTVERIQLATGITVDDLTIHNVPQPPTAGI